MRSPIKRLVQACLGYALILISAGCSPVGQLDNTIMPLTSNRPNIVFILVDDMGQGDAGYLGSEIATPNIDALAQSGMVLDRAYVYALCSPTRAALMSGRNPVELGIDGPLPNDAALPPGIKLLPEFLSDAGYDTWMVGKWHLGISEVSQWPNARGFDYFYGHLGGFIDFYTHVYLGGLDWQRNGTTVREEGHSTDLLTKDAVRLISEETSDRPFFLYLAYNAPHTPLQYPPAVRSQYDDIVDMDRRVFAQMMTDLDQHIGEVVAALEASGQLENTLIVFSSDNGGNESAGADNGQLRSGKGSVYEGGVRVPAVASWPGVIPAGERTQVPVFIQDWLPTLVQIASGDIGSQILDGRSLFTLLTGRSAPQRDQPMILASPQGRAVIDWPFKLVRNYPRPALAESGQSRRDGPSAALTDELYNIAEDPFEQTNLAAGHPRMLARLAQRLTMLDQAAIAPPAPPAPRPEGDFMGGDGNFDYDLRLKETRPPWADAAIGREPL